MSKFRYLAIGCCVAAIAGIGGLAIAQSSAPGSSPLLEKGAPSASASPASSAPVPVQPAAPAPLPGVASQGGASDATLEIAPQPGTREYKPGVEEIPGGRNFKPGEETTSINPNYRPGTEGGASSTHRPNYPSRSGPHPKPYLGISVKETDMCFKGKEEHGLEVLTVDPNGPAATAGIRGQTGANAVGASGSTLAALLPGVGTIINSQLLKHGDLGMRGDLIVAVDDQRVRTQQDFEDALAKLKPGDTMYITVLRPLPGHNHTTQKIAVHVGRWGQPVAATQPPATE